MDKKLAVAMFGQKRLSREGGVEIVVKELCTRMARDGYEVTCFNRGGHHVSGAEYDDAGKMEYEGIRQKTVPTIDAKGLAAVSSSGFAALYSAFGKYDVVHIHGRILSGFGYIAVGWIVAKKKILSGRISIILGLILLGALYLAGDTWGFLLKFLIAEILLSASCKVTLPQHPIWEHMRYVSEIIYFTHMWVAFSYTLIFREFRYYGADIFFASTLIPIILYYILYRSHMLSKVKTIL